MPANKFTLEDILPYATPKPSLGESCTGCGYCCAVEPCMLAVDYLKCSEGPCVALEVVDSKLTCGLVSNPLGYLFKAAHPEHDLPAPVDSEQSTALSKNIASALGIGLGCDSDDSAQSSRWPIDFALTSS